MADDKPISLEFELGVATRLAGHRASFLGVLSLWLREEFAYFGKIPPHVEEKLIECVAKSEREGEHVSHGRDTVRRDQGDPDSRPTPVERNRRRER